MIIHLGNSLPNISSDLPGNETGRFIVTKFDLAPCGVYPAFFVTEKAVRSYRTISPLRRVAAFRGVFSVALSLGSLPVPVRNHTALRSSDFPRLSPRSPPLLR